MVKMAIGALAVAASASLAAAIKNGQRCARLERELDEAARAAWKARTDMERLAARARRMETLRESAKPFAAAKSAGEGPVIGDGAMSLRGRAWE